MSELERLILNPVEFTPELPEIDLEDLGLSTAANPGPDYGESSMTVERVRQAIGEGVTDAHWPSVECTVPLIARGSKDLPIADPLHRLEAWVADVQRRRSGWIRRDFSTAAGFAGSVGCPVDMAGLTPAQGWSFAHDQVAPDIVLKLSRYPIWYATTEILAGEAKGSAVRDLTLELAELLGTAPGLIRLVVKNEGAEDWRGAIVAIECDSYSPAGTALPKYEAQKLTLKGGSTISGSSVKCPPLTAGWQTVLSSEIPGTGHMTHIGPRRMLFRLQDTAANVGDVQWKLEWRQLGQAAWVQTMESSTPIVVSSGVAGGNPQIVDLGECRPERAITGLQRWEWRLQVRSLSGSGTRPLILHVYPTTTEQWLRVADTTGTPIDGEPTKTPGTVEDNAGVGSIAWATPANAQVEDGVCTTATNSETEAKVSHYLKATGFGYAIPTAATILGISATVRRRCTNFTNRNVEDSRVRIVKGGEIKGTVDHALAGAWSHIALTAVTYGGAGDLWGQTWASADINAATFGIAIAVALPKKETGNIIAEIDSISLRVEYAEGANMNRVCFASRSVEFSDSGIRRQHVTDEVWGGLIPEGFDLQAPVPGQADQSMRALIVPSVGDFDARVDAATVKPSAKMFYRPGYLFAREAT